ncbi:MAG: FlaA1/EpsC-like NDP-sugar epimerase, partial [Halieaceae bacterium]
MASLVGTVRIFNHHLNIGYSMLAVIDTLIFLAAAYAGSSLYFAYFASDFQVQTFNINVQALLFALASVMAMFSMGLYEPKLREGLNGILLRTAGAVGLMTLAMTLIFYFLPDLRLWRGSFVLSAAIAYAGALTNRLLWTRFIDLEQFKRRVLILGAGETAAAVNSRMRRKADRRGFRVVGFLRMEGEETHIDKEPVLTLDCKLSEYVRRHNIDDIVIAIEDRRENMPQEELGHCRSAGVRVSDVVDFFEREAGKVLVKHVQPNWFTFAEGFQRGGAGQIGKRLFDVTMSFILLMAAWPIMLLAVLAIW